MTDFEDKERATDDELRPIPDGGLASTLPDWLKEKPAWARDASSGSDLPPDISPIDPRTLVHEDDFPDWLRAIARRGTEVETTLPEIEPVAEEPDFSSTDPVSDEDREPVTTWLAEPPVTSPGAAPWIGHEVGEAPVPGLDHDVALRRWIESGETIEEPAGRWRDPMVLGLIGAGLLIVIVAAVLLTR
jgi:hypothetical protein